MPMPPEHPTAIGLTLRRYVERREAHPKGLTRRRQPPPPARSQHPGTWIRVCWPHCVLRERGGHPRWQLLGYYCT